jgi:hypothetical protein
MPLDTHDATRHGSLRDARREGAALRRMVRGDGGKDAAHEDAASDGSGGFDFGEFGHGRAEGRW